MTNDERDPVEVELEALRPIAPSSELYRRIGDALAPASARPWRTTLAIAAITAAAACVALVTWLARPRDNPTVSNEFATTTTVPAPLAVAQSATALRDYRQALAESPARLEALLDAQSYRPMGPPDPAPPAASLARINQNWVQ